MKINNCAHCGADIERGYRANFSRSEKRQGVRLETLAEYETRSYCSRECNLNHTRPAAAMVQVAELRELSDQWDAHVRRHCQAGRRWLWGQHVGT